MAQPAAPIPVNIIDRENKIPQFHADPHHDTFQAEHWIDRLQRLKVANQWTDAQTICHAIHALRGDALHFLQYLRNNYAEENADTTNWTLFKAQFVIHFGKLGRDTSNITNLAIMQRQNESVQKFSHRVAVTTQEFFDAVNVPDTPNFNLVANNPEWVQIVQNEQAQAIITFYCRQQAKAFRSTLDRTIFLNGLNVHINTLVKNTSPQTMTEAVETAIKFERNKRGPIDHTIALEKSINKTTLQSSVNAIRRGGYRGRGKGTFSRGEAPASTNGFPKPSSNSNGTRKPMDCWYCRKPGHAQINCRKRLARGAATVPKPRSVAEITADNIGYQDDSEEEEVAEDGDEYDDYLEDSLNDDVDVSALHLN